MLRLRRFLPSFAPLSSLALLGLLAGCGGRTETRPVSLEELADRTLTFTLVDLDQLETPDAAGSHRFTLTLSQPEEGCTQLEAGVTATFNGQLMELEPGGIVGTGGREVCEETRAWLDFNPEAWDAEPVEDARVFLQGEDGARVVTLILQGAKAKRHFVYEGVGAGTTLRQGQRYTYRWQPAEESPGPVTASLLREEGRAPAFLQVEQDGSAVSFTLPEATPAAIHLLTLSANLEATVLDCEGVAACVGGIRHASDFEVTVAP
ncbi:hypothetical protein [Hyalangium rubrum]|uniref:Lipoprotein n=1 Tax=Hyalangium rubrum TaxID=3103134 RepID=A0ABU5H0G6_9BACT|nr:hypothetical protein [Hyalangium sp. s54d21]MDY7226924.1 hypothetical protein [Hyalangium sp. s54d21]